MLLDTIQTYGFTYAQVSLVNAQAKDACVNLDKKKTSGSRGLWIAHHLSAIIE